jgi:hypothetical protein
MPSENQLAVAFDPDKAVGVADFGNVLFVLPLVALFFLAKSPNLIGLHIADG